MKKFVVVSAVALCAAAVLGGAADAADLAVKAAPVASPAMFSPAPIATWTGFYVGLNGGGGWGTSNHTLTITGGGAGGSSGDFNVSGGLFGGTIGYNYQMGPWVMGGEADLDWANIRGSQTLAAFGAVGIAGTGSVSSQLSWLDTVRLRLGYAFGPSLLYITGGAAYGSVTAQINAAAAGVAGFLGQSDTRLGWTFGGGWEYMFTPHLSGKIEYLYVDFGTNAQVLVDNVKFNTNIIRAGVNWRF
jgi:outer membrane immunogenic protein